MKKETDRKVLQVKRLTNKVKGLDIKGQGCMDDCAEGYWSGSGSSKVPGCDYKSTGVSSRSTSKW